MKGTLALLLLAKQGGIIPSAATAIQSLVTAGFRVDDWLVREALAKIVGETWPP